jgi:hypothetical protein
MTKMPDLRSTEAPLGEAGSTTGLQETEKALRKKIYVIGACGEKLDRHWEDTTKWKKDDLRERRSRWNHSKVRQSTGHFLKRVQRDRGALMTTSRCL